MSNTLLKAIDLRKYYSITKGSLFSKIAWAKAVDGINFSVVRGTTFGLVGESGCGKTTTAKLILRLQKPTSGSLRFRDTEVTTMEGASLKTYRSQVQAVLQDPCSSLNPRMSVGNFVAEPMIVNRTLPRHQVPNKVKELLQQVGLPPESAGLYPHEFSGGQRQRIAIARAIGINPSLVVLDEPVSGLDISIRAQVINLLSDLQTTLGLTYFLIAHDLTVVRHMCSQVAVMYLGKIVELASADELFSHPLHPYTCALLSAALLTPLDTGRNEATIVGDVPTPLDPPSGCRFHPRCHRVMHLCSVSEPVLTCVGHAHEVACHHDLSEGGCSRE